MASITCIVVLLHVLYGLLQILQSKTASWRSRLAITSACASMSIWNPYSKLFYTLLLPWLRYPWLMHMTL
jgi:hypothetical protein